MLQIEKDFTKVPGVKKLTNKKDLYRVRLGKYRLVFRANGKLVEIVRDL